MLQACGSAGTTAGIALGSELSGLGADIHAFAVCDDPDYFYEEVDGLITELGYQESRARDLFTAHQAKGIGYAMSQEEELKTVRVRI